MTGTGSIRTSFGSLVRRSVQPEERTGLRLVTYAGELLLYLVLGIKESTAPAGAHWIHCQQADMEILGIQNLCRVFTLGTLLGSFMLLH